jgi:hypothetical protein
LARNLLGADRPFGTGRNGRSRIVFVSPSSEGTACVRAIEPDNLYTRVFLNKKIPPNPTSSPAPMLTYCPNDSSAGM